MCGKTLWGSMPGIVEVFQMGLHCSTDLPPACLKIVKYCQTAVTSLNMCSDTEQEEAEAGMGLLIL